MNYYSDQLGGFRESYRGFFGESMKDPERDYAYQYVKKTGLLSGILQAIERYFDYETFSKDLFLDGYSEYERHVFVDY